MTTIPFVPSPGTIASRQRNLTQRLIDALQRVDRADWLSPERLWDYGKVDRCAMAVALHQGIVKRPTDLIFFSPLGMTQRDAQTIFFGAALNLDKHICQVHASDIAELLAQWLAAQTVTPRFPRLQRWGTKLNAATPEIKTVGPV